MELSSELLTKEELQRLLRVSRTSVERMLADKTLPAYRVGRRSLRFDRQKVLRALAIGKVD